VAPAPTAPNVMVLPRTLPVIGYVPLGRESLIDPVSFDPVCFQWSVKVPE
jgi:hypothetical protein